MDDVSGAAQNRILVVEDNPTNRAFLCALLQRLELTVDVAINGKEAVDAISNSALGTYTLVLMDVQMPVMDGIEATSRIRQIAPKGSGLKICAVTAHATADYRARCFDAGMDDFLTKPLDPRELAKVITAAFEDQETEGNIEPAKPQCDTEQAFDRGILEEMKSVMNDEQVTSLVVACLDSICECLRKIQTLSLPDDVAELNHFAHDLKSVSAQIGASRLSNLGRQLETGTENWAVATGLSVQVLEELRAAIDGEYQLVERIIKDEYLSEENNERRAS